MLEVTAQLLVGLLAFGAFQFKRSGKIKAVQETRVLKVELLDEALTRIKVLRILVVLYLLCQLFWSLTYLDELAAAVFGTSLSQDDPIGHFKGDGFLEVEPAAGMIAPEWIKTILFTWHYYSMLGGRKWLHWKHLQYRVGGAIERMPYAISRYNSRIRSAQSVLLPRLATLDCIVAPFIIMACFHSIRQFYKSLFGQKNVRQ